MRQFKNNNNKNVYVYNMYAKSNIRICNNKNLETKNGVFT